MHYMLAVPGFEDGSLPTSEEDAETRAIEAGRKAFADKLASLGEYSDQLLSLVMLHVLDEKWKDHLYDLDQLRNAIHYRSWGQKDPLIEYKQEAYSMFVDLMNDVAETFTDRFLKVQLVIGEERPPEPPPAPSPAAPTRRYNAMGVLEDVPATARENGTNEVADVGPAESPSEKPAVMKRDPVVVGAGKARSMTDIQNAAASGPVDWANVGRNDPCPCGSGKKFKKCHGVTM
jgi:preprotein translocase subunit SecA